jgi:hypothetical protein
MCNYSRKFSQTRKAVIGEVLAVRRSSEPDEPSYLVGSGTDGGDVVVCLQHGTELAFAGLVEIRGISFKLEPPKSTLATFIKGDMLHFACGRKVHIGWLMPGQTAKVLQLPAERAICEELNRMLSRRRKTLETLRRNHMANGLIIPGATLLPDNVVWKYRMEIKSETSDRIYIVAQRKTDGAWACSCMGWIRFRHCKHLQAMKPALAASGLDVKSISESPKNKSPKATPKVTPKAATPKAIPKFEL